MPCFVTDDFVFCDWMDDVAHRTIHVREKKLKKNNLVAKFEWLVKTVTVSSRFYCCVFLVELRTANILVGPDLMYEIYYICRELYRNCHGVLKSAIYLRSVHT